jgi:hypothetical protein
MDRSISEQHKRRAVRDRWGAGIVGLIFAGLGLGFASSLTWPVLRDGLGAQSWVATPCVILTSEITFSRDSDGTTSRVAIRYRYTFEGREYVSDRYGILTISTDWGRESKAEAVRRHPPGSGATCFVNPQHPARAVLDRNAHIDWVSALLPVAFVAVGTGTVVSSIFGRRLMRRTKATPSSYRESATRSGWVPLVPEGGTPWAPAGAIKPYLFTGFLAVAMWYTVGPARTGNVPPPGIRLFLLGLGTLPFLAVLARDSLGLFNPRPSLAISQTEARPGERLSLKWSLVGRASRVRRFAIALQGQEVVEYSRGTDTIRESHTFATILVADETDVARMTSGEAPLDIPSDAMHTFVSEHNSICWSISLHLSIPFWTDVNLTYPLRILPL